MHLNTQIFDVESGELDDKWYGQYVELSDVGDDTVEEAKIFLTEGYMKTVDALRAQGYTPINEFKWVVKEPMYDYDSMEMRRTVAWKQRFAYKSKFKQWLDKFKESYK